jgi:hypothetical protein
LTNSRNNIPSKLQHFAMSLTTAPECGSDYHQEGNSEYFGSPISPSQPKSNSVNVQKLAEDGSVLPSVDLGLRTPPTSPSRKMAHAKPIIEQSTKDTISIDSASLKALLGPEKSRKCQSPKKSKSSTGSEFCEHYSPIKNRELIASQIKAMAEVSLHIQELRHKLCQLAELVHCRMHHKGNYTMQRADTWLRQYATGDDKIELEIQHVLGPLSNKCMMFVDGKDQCKSGIGGKKVEICRRTRHEIVKLRIDSRDDNLDRLLGYLESNMNCIDHSPNECFQRVESWRSGITGIRKVDSESSFLQSAERTVSTSIESDSTTAINENTRESPESLMPKSSRTSSSDIEELLKTISNVGFDTSRFDIVEKISEYTDTESCKQRIRDELQRSIQRTDFEKYVERTQTDIKVKELLLENGDFGYVYIYEVEGNEGYIKIGYTTKSAEDRLEDWTFRCNREAKVLYPRDVDKAVRVFHPKRLEALCHAELHDHRINVNCNGCLTTHNEWFKISKEVGVAVVKKWTRWMATVPYENSGVQQSEGKMIHSWTLTRSERTRARDLDCFMDHISAAVASTMTSGLDTEKMNILVKATADLRI